MAIVDFETAKLHLRVDHDEDDVDITFKLEQASAIIIDFLKMPPGTWDLKTQNSGSAGTGDSGSAGDTAPMQVQAATLMVLGELYKNRESSADPLSKTVKDMLRRLRDPALA